ncbi:MAG: acyltransferase [Byssovorax sp.]
MAGERRPQEHLDFLDGVRALLALYVVQRHAEVFFWKVTESHVTKGLSPWTVLRYAHFAVDIFIVISGFCLFLPVVRAAGELRGGASRFFSRRALRILPPYYAAVVASIVGLWIRGQARQFTGQNFATVWHHALLVHDALSPFALNSALWSVAVECHVYLLFPLLVLSWKRTGPVATFAWASLLAGGIYALLLRHPSLRVITPQYLVLFLIGMLGAAIFTSPRWEETKKLPWGVFAAVLIPGMMAVHHFAPPRLVDTYLGVEDVLVGLGAMSLLLAGSRPGIVARALSVRPLVFLGSFSYSIYLIHIPILELLARFASSRLDLSGTSGVVKLLIMGVLVAIATAGAYVFYLAFERPVVRMLGAKRAKTAETPEAKAA